MKARSRIAQEYDLAQGRCLRSAQRPRPAAVRPGSSYPAFQRQLRLLRPALVKGPEIQLGTDPWIQIQADLAQLGLRPLGCKLVDLRLMVTILHSIRRQRLIALLTVPSRRRRTYWFAAAMIWAASAASL